MLFKAADIDTKNIETRADQRSAAGVTTDLINKFASGEKLDFIAKTIGNISPGESIFFKTDGAWSNIHLLEFLLNNSGPANVYFSTWSIAADAIVRFTEWHSSGLIKQLFVLLDAGIRNRKPEIYQLATGSFINLKTTHCHAKVTVIENEEFEVTIMGSANYTRNPRIEAGMIIRDKTIAQANIKWILEEIYK